MRSFIISFVMLLAVCCCYGQPADDAAFVAAVATPAATESGPSLVSFSDNFNRANSTSLGSDWSETVGNCGIGGNAMTNASRTDSEAVFQTATTGINQYAKITFSQSSANSWYWIILRGDPDGTPRHYILFSDSDNMIWWTDSAENEVQSVSQAVANGQAWGVTIIGTGNSTVVRLWLNPTGDSPDTGGTTWGGASPTHTFTDNPPSPRDTGNYIGIGMVDGDSTIACDDFFGGDVPQ